MGYIIKNNVIYSGETSVLSSTYDDNDKSLTLENLGIINDAVTSPTNVWSSSKVQSQIPFRFGITEDGQYGYYKDGADTVTPFKVPFGIYDKNTKTLLPKLPEEANYYYVRYYGGVYTLYCADNEIVVKTSSGGNNDSYAKDVDVHIEVYTTNGTSDWSYSSSRTITTNESGMTFNSQDNYVKFIYSNSDVYHNTGELYYDKSQGAMLYQ